ncbi:hypothetical protein AcetOrient_orf04404 [Acetobacter orientalis]|uniref:Uncharacterized protein n=1 Tax=Acetobacter orientalis TaxID=146474 RepID=A0A2Z5ZMF3_9PROT|nr:hypothetical protein AcetOrient_orf04404 [Acetobacter orientalis]
MIDPIFKAVNQIYATHLVDDLRALSDCMKAIRAEGAKTDNEALEIIGILENLERKAKHAQALMRTELANQMLEDGVTGMQSQNWKATLAEAARTAIITDEKALKSAMPELWAPQPDKLNKTELNKLARKGDVPGVSLSNGGAPVLRVSAKKGE